MQTLLIDIVAKFFRVEPLRPVCAVTLRERDRLAARANHLAARGEGHVEYHALTSVDAIESHGPDKGFRVAARRNGEEMVWEVERIIANVGYRADLSICHELHVADPDGKQGLRHDEPNYYLLGAKSFGRNANFLLRYGFEQIRDCERLQSQVPALCGLETRDETLLVCEAIK